MPKRIVLDREYIARVKKDNAPLMAAVATMEQKKIPCKFCKLRTIDKYEDLQGHFSAFCNRCGQVAVYNAGIARDNLMAFMSPREWDEVIETNVNGF